jgi:dihydroorotate dehydrogenase electron transfer subunit
VVGNDKIAELTFRLRVVVDGGFPAVLSGQFVMIRLADDIGLLLGRPLAIYKVEREVAAFGGCDIVEVIYLAAGRVTSKFSELTTGSRVRLWGPLGRGFEVVFDGHTILVAGGVGHTPFLMLAEKLKRVTLLYGAKHAGRIVPLDDFEKLGVATQVATDDGSFGFNGLVTALIDCVYRRGELTRVLCCGSLPMLKAAFKTSKELGLPCVVSLETPMSCGLGLCYGCVVKVQDDDDANGWSYQRTCVEGPAFDAYKLIF